MKFIIESGEHYLVVCSPVNCPIWPITGFQNQIIMLDKVSLQKNSACPSIIVGRESILMLLSLTLAFGTFSLSIPV